MQCPVRVSNRGPQMRWKAETEPWLPSVVVVSFKILLTFVKLINHKGIPESDWLNGIEQRMIDKKVKSFSLSMTKRGRYSFTMGRWCPLINVHINGLRCSLTVQLVCCYFDQDTSYYFAAHSKKTKQQTAAKWRQNKTKSTLIFWFLHPKSFYKIKKGLCMSSL